MSGPTALDALERARRAQERFERRIDVQLRLGLTEPEVRGGNTETSESYVAASRPDSGSVRPR